MAKSGFWLRGAKGKLAGTVLYQSGGSTVQREIVTPKNPQSDNQMRQRATFAGAAKFYQNAQQNRFVLAFQNKKGNQSEFNAFMQKNLREFDTLTYPTREMANTPEFCNYFPWICTEGNLQGIPAAFPDDEMEVLGAEIVVCDPNWAANWDELIAMNPNLDLQYGDIVTITIVLNDEKFNDITLDVEVGNIAPRWITRQFIVGADLGGYTLEQYFTTNGFTSYSMQSGNECIAVNLNSICEELGIIEEGDPFHTTEVAAMICVTRSRNENGTLKVSSSRFELDDMAQRIFERLSNDTQMREAIASYKKSVNSNSVPTNILQGSVAEDIPVSIVQFVDNADGVAKKAGAPVSGLAVRADKSTGNSVATIYVAGENVKATKVTAVATGYTVKVESSKIYTQAGQGIHSMVALPAAKVTLTKTGTTAGSTAFTIAYAGITCVAGNLVVA